MTVILSKLSQGLPGFLSVWLEWYGATKHRQGRRFAWQHKNRMAPTAIATLAAISVAVGTLQRRSAARKKAAELARLKADVDGSLALASQQGKKRVMVNREFFKRLVGILRVVIPGWRSKESIMLMLHTCFLIVRTYLSVVGARIDGQIVRYLVSDPAHDIMCMRPRIHIH